MYEIIKSVIQSKDYELRDMLYKINKMYIESAITEAQKTELDELARINAVAENSYATAKEQIENIYKEIESIKADIKELKKENNQEITSTEPENEYPLYKQPQGSHDAYKVAEKVTYNSKKYICKLDNCVWSPEEYPQGWELVEREV